MSKITTHPDVKIYNHNVHYDFRGELWTLWKEDEFYPQLNFNHDKVSTSRKHVLRGIHGDTKSWKLIECLYEKLLSYPEERCKILLNKTNKLILQIYIL